MKIIKRIASLFNGASAPKQTIMALAVTCMKFGYRAAQTGRSLDEAEKTIREIVTAGGR